MAKKFAVLWMLNNYCFNCGLVNTSVASSTVLSNTGFMFVFVIEIVLFAKAFNFENLNFVILALVGVALITYSDLSNSASAANHSLCGDFLAMGSAFCFALYTCLLGRNIGNQ